MVCSFSGTQRGDDLVARKNGCRVTVESVRRLPHIGVLPVQHFENGAGKGIKGLTEREETVVEEDGSLAGRRNQEKNPPA